MFFLTFLSFFFLTFLFFFFLTFLFLSYFSFLFLSYFSFLFLSYFSFSFLLFFFFLTFLFLSYFSFSFLLFFFFLTFLFLSYDVNFKSTRFAITASKVTMVHLTWTTKNSLKSKKKNWKLACFFSVDIYLNLSKFNKLKFCHVQYSSTSKTKL